MIYLGTINNAGSDVKNNVNTSTPFVIPPGTVGLRLQPSAATMMAACEFNNANTGDSSFAPASTAMLQLGAANSVNDLPMRVPPGAMTCTLAVRKTDVGAGTTAVFAIGFGQSQQP